MIKLPILESSNKPPSKLEQYLPTKIFISEPLALDGAALIPIDLGGRLIAPSVSINDLGKQLLKAAADGEVEEIRQLLSQGAPFTADWLGTSPLHLAAQGNHLEVCEILLRAGISKDARTKVDRTPLHMAAYEGHLDIVDILIRNGADLECTDLLCMTPLHWATQNGHANVVATLIRFGAAIESVNKFNLTPIDIAKQINRHDLAELLSMHTYDHNVATDNLVIELSAAEYSKDSNIDVQPTSEVASPTSSPLHVEEKSNGTVDDTEDTQDGSYSESAIKLLQEHGITMLPNDDSNILTSVMENGHSVVLTDVGKEVLNSVKSSEENDKSMQKQINDKNFITVTPDEFLALTANASINSTNILRQMNGKIIPKTFKRIVMKRNKVIPVSTVPNIQQPKSSSKPVTDMETVMMQLIEARKTIEEYKEKLEMKEQEAERYKEQLKIFMSST